MSEPSAHAAFRSRLIAGERLIGTFVKTPAISTVEILGGAGLDFVVIDQEHAPLDRASIDMLIPAARWSGLAALVRISGPAPDAILSALDSGATGVLVPHVSSAAKAAEMVRASSYRPNGRGFSNSVRAADYGALKLPEHVAASAKAVVVIAQIEDREALDEIDAIAATEGIDALFIGLADLTVSFGVIDMAAPVVVQATRRIAAAARAAGKPLCVVAATSADAAPFADLGASVFVSMSDQGYLRKAAIGAVEDFARLAHPKLEKAS